MRHSPFFGGFHGSFACVPSIPWEISGLLTRFWASGSNKSHDLFAQWGGPSTSPALVVCWISEHINFQERGVIKGILPMIFFSYLEIFGSQIFIPPYKKLIKTTIVSGLEQLTPTICRIIEKLIQNWPCMGSSHMLCLLFIFCETNISLENRPGPSKKCFLPTFQNMHFSGAKMFLLGRVIWTTHNVGPTWCTAPASDC